MIRTLECLNYYYISFTIEGKLSSKVYIKYLLDFQSIQSRTKPLRRKRKLKEKVALKTDPSCLLFALLIVVKMGKK